MKEDIEILKDTLEKYCYKNCKGEIDDSCKECKRLKAIENLIKDYKKLKEDFEIVDHECSRLEKEDIRKDIEIKELQKELDKYKEMYAVSIADRVNSAFKQEHKNNEDLEMLYKGCQIESEKKNKTIELMASFIASQDIEEAICEKTGRLDECDSMACGECENCIIKYFTKKSEDK